MHGTAKQRSPLGLWRLHFGQDLTLYGEPPLPRGMKTRSWWCSWRGGWEAAAWICSARPSSWRSWSRSGRSWSRARFSDRLWLWRQRPACTRNPVLESLSTVIVFHEIWYVVFLDNVSRSFNLHDHHNQNCRHNHHCHHNRHCHHHHHHNHEWHCSHHLHSSMWQIKQL